MSHKGNIKVALWQNASAAQRWNGIQNLRSVEFPHSHILLHYAFSSWIEKTTTKTIHCHWENRFVLQQYGAVRKFYFDLSTSLLILGIFFTSKITSMNPFFTYDSSQQIKISIGTLRTTSLKKNHAVTNRSNRTK